jgi:hypothetical protein
MAQGGYLVRWNLRSREVKLVRPPAVHPDERLRFNWNAGFAVDPFEPGTIYYGSQYLHKSTDRGDTWTAISPDLTSNNPEWQKQGESGGLTPDVTGAENFTTILAVAPSAVERGVIWVGTDDGRVQITRDGGKNWTSVEKNLPGVPANTWVPHIRPSKFQGGGAFVVLDDHRRSNWTPYVYRTDDYGKTWKSLATPNLRGWALSIEQDPVDPDLLFLGTEFGLYVSLDGGKAWMPWHSGLPTAPVADLIVHPRDHDLVVATHGRALYILDDIAPLRQMTAAALAEPVHLFPATPAILHHSFTPGGAARPGAGEFRGENRPYGAILTYSLNLPGLPLADDEKERERKEKERTLRTAARSPEGGDKEGEEGKAKKAKAEIRITDASGKLVRKLDGPADLGANRTVWDLSRTAFRQPPSSEQDPDDQDESGPQVSPGTYDVTVKYGDHEARGKVQVVADPYTHNTDADWGAREAAVTRAGAVQDTTVEAIERIAATRKDVDFVLARLAQQDKERERANAEDNASATEDPHKALKQSARDLRRKLSDLEKRLYLAPDVKGIPDRDVTVLAKIGYVMDALGSSWDRPDATDQAYLDEAETDARAVLADFNRLFAGDVAAFRGQVQQAGIGLLQEEKPLEVPPPSS